MLKKIIKYFKELYKLHLYFKANLSKIDSGEYILYFVFTLMILLPLFSSFLPFGTVPQEIGFLFRFLLSLLFFRRNSIWNDEMHKISIPIDIDFNLLKLNFKDFVKIYSLFLIIRFVFFISSFFYSISLMYDIHLSDIKIKELQAIANEYEIQINEASSSSIKSETSLLEKNVSFHETESSSNEKTDNNYKK
jgi:hypothetical protein